VIRNWPLDEKTLARYWAKVDKNGPTPAHRPELGPCWLWTAAQSGNGYGSFHPVHDQTVNAHEISYRLAKGEMPEGFERDHLCRVRHCVNPDHIEAVTVQVNRLRGSGITAAHHRKTHCAAGHPMVPGNLNANPQGIGRGRCRECTRARSREFTERKKREREGRFLTGKPVEKVCTAGGTTADQ